MYRRAVLVRVLSGVALLAGLLPATAHAQEQTLDQEINDAVSPVTDKIVEIVFYELDLGGTGLPLIVVWLILGAIFFTSTSASSTSAASASRCGSCAATTTTTTTRARSPTSRR
jgi:hypothetical protein